MNLMHPHLSKQNVNNFVYFYSDNRKNLDGEVFEMLLTLSDFMAFKEMVLDYKAVSTTYNNC